jgi:hypothetical protein
MSKYNVLPEEREKYLRQLIKKNEVTVGTIDTETCPIPAWVWGCGEQVIGYEQIESDFTYKGKPISGETKLIMAQYIIEGQKTKVVEWDKNHNDIKVCMDLLSNVFDKPNLILVGQNQNAFDIKIINDRLVKHKLNPINFNRIIFLDALTLSRASFRRTSHKLDYRSKRYGLGGKLKMEFQDWINTVKYDPKAQKKMVDYGRKDPEDTISVFWRELPYYKNLPAKLESLLRQERDKEILVCLDCQRKKQQKFNVVKVDNKTCLCKNCKSRWRI